MTVHVSVDRLRAPGALRGRSCDGCTVCCTVMAVPELHKGSRRACDHVGRDGCRAHDTRPESCRLFHCAWLRGAIDGGDDMRPDALGVMVDYFIERGTGAEHLIAFELWAGAIEAPLAQSALRALAAVGPLTISHRDGRWSTLAPPP